MAGSFICFGNFGSNQMMMLFNLFGKAADETAGRVFTDKVYISTEAKRNACIQLVKEQPNTLFIAWFPDTVKKFKEYFQQTGIDTACITEARLLHSGKLINHTPVFLEHYPLHEKELAMVEKWQEQKIIVYSAMDEPLFKHFGSDKMIPLIKLLGMKENEFIEHAYVTESIIKKSAKNCFTGNPGTNSQLTGRMDGAEPESLIMLPSFFSCNSLRP